MILIEWNLETANNTTKYVKVRILETSVATGPMLVLNIILSFFQKNTSSHRPSGSDPFSQDYFFLLSLLQCYVFVVAF